MYSQSMEVRDLKLSDGEDLKFIEMYSLYYIRASMMMFP